MTRTAARRKASSPPAPRPEATRPAESHRETIESIVVAFILALVIRGFSAEAFVIPTGSMAPTLMGRHKEVDCPQCGITFTVNAADEPRTGRPVTFGTCFNCRSRTQVDDLPSFNGDRILVMKFPYKLPFLPFADRPERWDVVVFHYPEAPEQNYIKRLIGLPGEELMIRGGDLYSRPLGGDEPFRILRKPLRHLRAMLMPVYDDRHRATALTSMPSWRRWDALDSGDWEESADEPGTFASSVKDGERLSWLRYRHLVPDQEQWRSIQRGQEPEGGPAPSLVEDFLSYNSNQGKTELGSPPIIEPHWVGDLAVEFDLEVESGRGRVVVELIEAGVPMRCTIDLAEGQATLTRDGVILGTPQACGIDGPGRYRVGLANVDDRLTLWVDGRTPFGEGVSYEVDHEEPQQPELADLSPIGIGASLARVRVSDLVVRRDIYYTLSPNASDLEGFGTLRSWDEYRWLVRAMSDPSRFPELARLDEPRTFEIRPGRYMMMGDNSPRSKDSRAWDRFDLEGIYDDDAGRRWRIGPWSEFDRAPHEVPEELIVGKAFFVYWPHGKPFGPDIRLSRDFRIPFRPYLERMQWIR
ncbi:signal peptidase I [Tautonia plasticadhaerens]|uniref:Signal peptidase I n=1 Tax=Tautonia plasticadhaerens TaxID=2527974 RepID=A0A518H880_9BACT|nr:signal peptidase I [Tautonia plasticadhaerens]QDV37067.1 Signal peptidase I [Tautonia plasticadhaerens]